MKSTIVVVAFLGWGVAGCHEDSSQAATSKAAGVKEKPPWASRITSGAGFPCDVDAALASSCRRCHWTPTENDAPFAFGKWQDVHETVSGKPIHKLMQQMIEADLMPPLDAVVKPKVDALGDAERKVLLGWLAAGAPKSEAPCADATGQ